MNTTYPLSSKKYIDKEVKQIRNKIAQEINKIFIESYLDDKPFFANRSFLKDHASTIHTQDPYITIDFNLYLIDQAVDFIINNYENPKDVIFLCSRLCEVSHYEFIDPLTLKTSRNLGASKTLGYFFTSPDIASLMARNLLTESSSNIKLLDPSAGMGVLAFAVLMESIEAGILVDEIHLIEIDEFTSLQLQKVARYLQERLSVSTEIFVKNKDALDYLTHTDKQHEFSHVIANPPYGRIKFLKSFLSNAETKVTTRHSTMEEQEAVWKIKVEEIKKQIADISIKLGVKTGLNDYYRVFMALLLDLLDEDGRMVIISPSTWLGDKESQDLRRSIIKGRWLEKVVLYSENEQHFSTVNQALAITLISKRHNNEFTLAMSNGHYEERKIAIDSIAVNDPILNRIPRIRPAEYIVFEKLKKQTKVKRFGDLKVARGEVDLTLDKDKITNNPSNVRLLRGEGIERFTADESSEQYIKESAHSWQMNLYRIAGRQISYLEKKRRLSFALIAPGTALGNSCNYLYFSEENPKNGISEELWVLLGILNSMVHEWYFRVYNSNNHVGIYEIEDLPLPSSSPETITALAKSAQFLTLAYGSSKQSSKDPTELEDFHEALVAYTFGLSEEDFLAISGSLDSNRSKRIVNMLSMIYSGEKPSHVLKSTGWYDHFQTSLSELDKEMIFHVPQGGNWQNIPESVPSQRLEQIREMSKVRGIGRTTYYGRLRPDQPSYTIATYFNRPGNGANIHPYEDRTISLREAARLQSFPDSYIFLGNEGSIRTQIGNAVPPLLAYAVGNAIRTQIGAAGSMVDAFVGAGGLSLGLEYAGWKSICANDIDKSFGQTYRFNRPSTTDIKDKDDNKTLFIEGDLHDTDVLSKIVSSTKVRLRGRKLDLIAGGPPCQGFSHAGFRREDDTRNNLAAIYLKLIKELSPETVILENVEGLLTFNKGQVIADLLLTLRELGYKTDAAPWVLSAEEYGVPQMRKRVLIVVNKNKVLLPPEKIYQKCLGRREKASATNMSTLPYPHTVAESLIGIAPINNIRFESTGSRNPRSSYAKWLKGFCSIDEMMQEDKQDEKTPSLRENLSPTNDHSKELHQQTLLLDS